ncbi:uncharacterized protein J4E87_009314 [Alternaria ethzedia]|uniref:uncharacterized protein n=1 Tax=Alternaria ethzedia TaxID=181014 RepID=UPI0020C32DAE|nr:uncharacterized protein J4E87_009314 [Alternaria ethzedia]KAI4614719.1 hypothetical protein J4E87_009314 [Alternaria ethzedia]
MASPTLPSTSSASLSSQTTEEKRDHRPNQDISGASTPPPTSKSDPTFITWTSPTDPSNPFNFSPSKKWRTTLLACTMTFVVQVSGTMLTSAAEQINTSFNVSDEAFPHSYWPVLSWNLGGAAAPLLGLPLMENFGVRWSYMAIYAVLIIFIIPQALAKNFATIFLSQIIFYSALMPVLFFLLPEVRPDVILTQRARHIRAKTGKEVYAQAEKEHTSFGEILKETLVRPTRMLCTEGVVLSFGLWSAFCIGTAFMFTQSIVQVFSELYGWTFFGTGLVQSAVVIGELIGLVASLVQDRIYFASARRNTETPGKPIPEARLYLSIPASFIGLSGGLFYFAWTSYSSIPWIVPSISLAFVGFGMFCSTAGVTTYVVDAYAKYAASAIAGIAFLENFMAAFLPLATQSMYRTLGFNWASSLLGFIALALSFIPLILLRFGKSIRGKSPFMSEAGYED